MREYQVIRVTKDVALDIELIQRFLNLHCDKYVSKSKTIELLLIDDLKRNPVQLAIELAKDMRTNRQESNGSNGRATDRNRTDQAGGQPTGYLKQSAIELRLQDSNALQEST